MTRRGTTSTTRRLRCDVRRGRHQRSRRRRRLLRARLLSRSHRRNAAKEFFDQELLLEQPKLLRNETRSLSMASRTQDMTVCELQFREREEDLRKVARWHGERRSFRECLDEAFTLFSARWI